LSFKRTDSGLSNMHLFVKVDAIIYVEGGETSYSLEDIKSGKYNKSSVDITFWRALFHYFLPGKKYHFRAVGSKSSLLELKELISKNLISNVYIAMDSDFDRHQNSRRKKKGIFCTHGYSWENDVWKPSVADEMASP